MVEVMKMMAASFKGSHTRTAMLSAPDPAADHCQPTPPQTPDIHGQVWVNLLWDHCFFFLSPGAPKFLFMPSKSLFPRPV